MVSRTNLYDYEPTLSVEYHSRRFRRATNVLVGATVAAIAPVSRGLLPEPFDVMSHVSNVAGSALVGFCVGRYVAGVCENLSRTFNVTPGRAQAAVAAAGGCAGLALNIVFELKTGINLSQNLPLPSTPDAIDFAYGVVSAPVAASLSATVNEAESAP